jgi:trans-2,3-dihydro-3-hydroxyanthranilate isomerase
MTQKAPVVSERIREVGAFATALDLARDDLQRDLPIEVVSCGVPFLFAPLTTRSAVDRASMNRSAYRDALRQSGLDELPLFVFTLDRTGAVQDEYVYSRMLAPGLGVS